MRKSSKTTKTAMLARVNSYHNTTDYTINYAFQGFTSNKYFTSDRYIPLDAHFTRPDGKALKGYGLEIETECRGISNRTVYAEILTNVIFPHFPADLFKLQHDGSLSGDTSAEIITQVMTKEFIRNNYASFKLMYDLYFLAFKISCTETGNCGMHVNLSNALFGATPATQAVAIKKLLYVVNHHYVLFCALTNRSLRRTEYCRQMPEYTSIDGCKNADLNRMPTSHGNSFNGSHYPEGRVELRVVGGQSTFACFRNTMESIFHLVNAVKKLSWADLGDPVKLFADCNQYVFDRLNTKVKHAGAISAAALMAIQQTIIHEELL